MKRLIPLFLAAVVTYSAFSDQKNKESLSPKALSDMTLIYRSTSWNRTSAKVDSAYLFLRDENSNRLAKIVLEETEPDSSVFKGKFSVIWDDLKTIKPEIYIPEKLAAGGEVASQQFEKLIANRDVIRKPFIYKKDENKKQVLEVFDTRQQASSALKIHKEEVLAEKQASAVTTDKVLNKSQEAFAREAKLQAELLSLQAEATKRENDRLRKELLEKQKQEARVKELAQQSAQEKARRKAQASQLVAQAIQFYQTGEFLKAEELFKKATELAPENNEYYFKYGVTLYRLEKFDESIVKLQQSKVSGSESLEKNYYLGMLHYRLKELDQALEKFEAVKQAKHPVLSPAAAFYMGVTFFGMEEFEKSKTNFEHVLDESQDPALDKQAEEYIEKCIKMLAYQKDLKRRHLTTVNFGLTYDSNVLFQPDNSTTTSATDKASARFVGGYTYEYRLTKKEESEMSLKSNGNMMYSAVTDLSTADPYMLNATYSYARKGSWGSKTYKFTTEPGYEILHMNLDGEGAIENILNTIVLSNSLMLVTAENRVSIYNIDLRSEDSTAEATSDDDESDAIKVNIKTTQMFFSDKAMKTAIIVGAGLTYNEAVGKNKDYIKADLMALYTAPLASWLSSWNAGVALYYQDYSNATTERTDQNYSLLGGVGKTWNEKLNSALSLNYGVNQSQDESNQYSRYTISVTTTYSF